MLIEGQKVIDIIEGHKDYGVNGILENIVEDIDNLCSDWEKMGLNINMRDDMKIGDEVYIHGYVDEIRKDTIIIKNEGGYFGTIPSEIIDKEQEPCKDDISRKAVLDTLDTADKFLDEDRTVERYKAILTDAYEVLPSVNPQEPKTDVLDKIRAIVKEWKDDSWTDGLSYECMIKISELFTESEG